MANYHPAWEKLEPEAQSGKRLDISPGEHAIELSKAISLKRIADALEKLSPPPPTRHIGRELKR